MKNVIKPFKVKSNSSIGIFTPSEPLTEKRVNRLNSNVEFLKSSGFKVKFPPNYRKSLYYMGGSVEQRISDISFLLDNKDVDILMATWGGKSSSQLLQYLDYDLIKRKQKPITAFSDGTLLLNAIFSQTDLITFSGPNVVGKLDESEWSDLSFFQNSTENLSILTDNNINRIISHGKIQGRLIGGNLSTFVLGLIGTPYIPKIEDMIFFWETGSATPQMLDQYLTLLENSGFFNHLNGMVVGTLENCADQKDWGQRSPFDILKNIADKYKIPIVQTESFGHEKRENPIFPIGALCELDTKTQSLTIIENIFK